MKRAPYDDEHVSLRDRFAMAAMEALLIRGYSHNNTSQGHYAESDDAEGEIGLTQLASDAYGIADAMLRYRGLWPKPSLSPAYEQAEPGNELCEE